MKTLKRLLPWFIASLIFIFWLLRLHAQSNQKTPEPIPTDYIVIVNALSSNLQNAQQQFNKAVATIETSLCKDAKIDKDKCLVNWKDGVIQAKVPEAPPAVPSKKK